MVALATPIATAAVASLACGGSDDADPTAPLPTIDQNAIPIERLTAAYSDPTLDPSTSAWRALLDDPGYETDSVAVTEFARLREGEDARTSYNTFVAAFAAAAEAAGATVTVNDIVFPGLEGLEGYEGGISWVAQFPAISAYVDAMLDEAVIAAAGARRDAVEEAQVLAGPNLLPDVIKQLGPNDNAADFPSDRVQGKTTDEIVGELLEIYPSGGADPTETTLRAMMDHEGFTDQLVFYINLYRFKPDGGEVALSEYNAAALPVVLAHGGRPKVLANVTHHLVGPTEWSRFIFVSWPSFAVFTDLRLDPTYVEAQRDRVVSAEEYGNLVNIARADRKEQKQTEK
jgi:uncharacterized protein (DUF1330 family)